MNDETYRPRRRSLRSQQLAVIAKGAFDIPPKIRHVLVVMGVCGIVMAIVASLVGNQPGTIAVDKVLHFSGYFLLSCVLVLGLSPVLYIPGLMGLAALGYAIEILQPLNGRSRDMTDLVANLIGIGCGAAVGLIVRFVYALIRKELTTLSVRRKLRTPTGAIVMREGEPSHRIYIIKSGQVALTKLVGDVPKNLTNMGAGEVIGLLGCIQGHPQYSTVTTTQPTVLYGMSLHELMDSVGGNAHPVALVLSTFAEKTEELVGRLNELEANTN